MLLGVAGEVIFDWKDMKGRLAWAKRLSALILIAGLVLEFSEAAKSDREVANTNLVAKQAETNAAASYERARIAEQNAGEANERAANTESNNLVLQAKVLEIEAKRQWRTITPEQKNAFIELTKNAFKFPIRVRMGANASTEVQSFGRKVREVLDDGGFVETNKELAIAEWPPEINLLYNGGLVNGKVPEMSSVVFVNNLATTSNIVDLRDAQISLRSFTNYSSASTIKTVFKMINEDSEQKAFISVENGEPVMNIPIPSKGGIKFSAFLYIQSVFNSVGITTEWMTMTNIPSGVCEVFIEPKF